MTKPIQPTFRTLLKHPAQLLAFGFGSGLLRPGPGTWGTFFGVLLFAPFWQFFLRHQILAAVFITAAFILGCWLCAVTSRALGVHDSGGIVWDEFVGVWLVMCFMPQPLFEQWGMLAAAGVCFLLFRIFDISKPPPIKQIDARAPGGFGVMIDDITAGLFALAALWITQQLL